MSRSTGSDDGHRWFCDEPWTGTLAIQVDQDVEFCPCYLKLRLGNLADATLLELWNAEPLQELRREFAAGQLPDVCAQQLCPVALREPGASSRSPAAPPRPDQLP